MTKNYLVIVSLLFLLCLACKKEMPMRSEFELSAAAENNKVILNWSPFLLSGFKSINIYRSVSPIPDPLFNKPIDPTLLIGIISDKSITTYSDSGLVLGSAGQVYYKIVLNLDNRVIPSTLEEVSLDGFSVTWNSTGTNSSNQIIPFPSKNLIYIVNNNSGTMSVVDYQGKKLLKSVFLTSYGLLYPVMNAGKPELFMKSTYSTISCYDALTLMAKYTINIPSGSMRDFCVKNNYMYILTTLNSTAKISTYDLSTQLLVNEKVVYNFTGSSACNLHVGTQSNTLFFKHYLYLYNSQLGNYTYRNACVKYNLVNHLPADSVIITHPRMNKDSLSGNVNIYYIQPSPDGNYVTCNKEGDILTFAGNSIHNVNPENFSNPMMVYSSDSQYLIVKPSNSSDLMNIYSLPNFNLVKSLKSPNPLNLQGSGSMIKNDFLDSDSLVSYNLIHTFSNNQTKSVFTVFFKKID
ncbi:MAG: hypothetical protein K0S53_1823 [Bacteroidetes bacterium]|jgi:hypothetical protein|nr:hypothetical protein [Bacteroidota bacterium]